MLLALLLAGLQVRLDAMFLQQGLAQSASAARGVVEGLPHWRIYQSRIFAPYLVEWLSRFAPSYADAHLFYAFAALTLAGYLALHCAWRLYGDVLASLCAGFAVHALFALLLARPWLYAWDYGALVAFVLFVYLAMARRGWPWFVALFAVAIINRESALFIAVWMIIDPLLRWLTGTVRDPADAGADRRLFAAGVICLAGGLAIVEGLRAALLVREVAPQSFGERAFGGSFHLRLPDNLDMVRRVFTDFVYPRLDPALYFMILVLLVAVAALVVVLACKDPARYLGLAAVHLALIASILAFGVLLEARVYIELIPIIVFGLLALVRVPASGRTPTDQVAEPRSIVR